MTNETVRLKTEDGFVVDVDKSCCHSPNENGWILFTLGGFSYGWGKPTDQKVTHYISNDLNESLSTRGSFVRIEDDK